MLKRKKYHFQSHITALLIFEIITRFHAHQWKSLRNITEFNERHPRRAKCFIMTDSQWLPTMAEMIECVTHLCRISYIIAHYSILIKWKNSRAKENAKCATVKKKTMKYYKLTCAIIFLIRDSHLEVTRFEKSLEAWISF